MVTTDLTTFSSGSSSGGAVSKTQLPSTTVFNDQANTYAIALDQIFQNQNLKLHSGTGIGNMIFKTLASAVDRTVTFPDVTSTVVMQITADTFTTNQKKFSDNILAILNPALTFTYNVRSSAITANRDVTLPLLTANDQFTFDNFPTTLTNKTFGNTSWNTSPSVFTNTIGSIFQLTNSAGLLAALQIVPNLSTIVGTRTGGQLQMFNSSDTTVNTEYLQLYANGTGGYFLDVEKAGTGSLRPLNLSMGGTSTITINTDTSINLNTLSKFTQPIELENNTTPVNPPAGASRIYTKTIDANNDGVFALVKKNGVFVEVQLA